MMTWDHPMIVLIDQEIWLKTKKLIKTEKLQYSTIQNESDQRMQHWKLSKKSQKSMNIKIQQMRLWIPRCKSQRTNKLLLPVYVYRTSIESFRLCIFLLAYMVYFVHFCSNPKIQHNDIKKFKILNISMHLKPIWSLLHVSFWKRTVRCALCWLQKLYLFWINEFFPPYCQMFLYFDSAERANFGRNYVGKTSNCQKYS